MDRDDRTGGAFDRGVRAPSPANFGANHRRNSPPTPDSASEFTASEASPEGIGQNTHSSFAG